jgi:ABC-2 type transport system ATP-binding protein
MLNVREKLNISVRELSLGERMKMELIASLLHQPKILFLDEPTIGLDVVSQKVVREFLKHHNATYKTTILLTSHYMADIQALCERVIIIDHGSLFFDGRLDDILSRFATVKIVTVQLGGGVAATHPEKYGDPVESNQGILKLRVPRERVIPVCKALLDELPVKDIDIEEVPVEDVIRQLFRREAP